MKRRLWLKLALAALLIALPLVLSGCYVSPNNIETGNNNSGEGFFPEFNPATATPTAAPTDAPSGQTAPSAVPTNNNSGVVQIATPAVNNWSTIAPMPASPTPAAGTVTPPASTPSPSPTPQASLKLGSKGDEVRSVQKKLKELGFLRGSVDGDFGEATEAAVKAFQKQYGLTVDGKVGPATLAKLQTATHTAKPTSSPTPKATATPSYSSNTYLRVGSSGSQVRQMQERLISLGYLAGRATSTFDNATEAGVLAFQRRNTSYADGVAGPETLKALYSSNAKSTSTASGIIGVTLSVGNEGPSVRVLQTRLKALGYYTGTVDGSFGEGTANAVKAFQRGNGLTADGKAGGETLNKLFSSSAKSYSQVRATATPKPTNKPTVRPTVTPRTTATPLPENVYVRVTPDPKGDYVTLRRGMYGDPVKQMQQYLKDQGYFTGSVDGYFGESTENAVKSFQRVNGLYVDGVAGPATLRVLIEGAFPYGS